MNNIKYKIFDYVKERDSLDNEISELKEKRSVLDKQIKKICHHPEDYVVEKQKYHEGNYYDRSYTEYWDECTLCNQRGDSWIGERGAYE